MIEGIRLRDGTGAFLLPLQRTDKATLAAEFEMLSPESRRRRFLAPVMRLSDAMLEHLGDDVDGIDHVARVLCAATSPDLYDPVALARLVRYADVPDAADLAVTVRDAWQGRGVATALLDVLMRGRPVGVDRIVTEVFDDNRASLLMLRRPGHAAVQHLGSGVSEGVLNLAPLEATASLPRDVDSHPDAKVTGLDPRVSLRSGHHCCATKRAGTRCTRAIGSVPGSAEDRHAGTRGSARASAQVHRIRVVARFAPIPFGGLVSGKDAAAADVSCSR